MPKKRLTLNPKKAILIQMAISMQQLTPILVLLEKSYRIPALSADWAIQVLAQVEI